MRRLLIAILFLTCTPTLAGLSSGCITPQAHMDPKKGVDFRMVVQDFHVKLRWALYEAASQYVSETYRNEFMGRWEERGEEYKITELEVKAVTMGDNAATVEVEQQWYEEPSMTVQKKRFMESWALLDGEWRLFERIPKSEFRARQKEAQKAAAGGADAGSADAAVDEEPEPVEPPGYSSPPGDE